MRGLFKGIGQDCHSMVIPNKLDVLQQLVGGPIEVVCVMDDVALVCNEHGKLLGLKPNFWVNDLDDYIVGPAIFVGTDKDDFCDINPLKERFIRFVLKEEGRL